MSEQARTTTRGAGPKVDKCVPSKRVKAAYHKEYRRPVANYNPANYGPRYEMSPDAPSLRAFVKSKADDGEFEKWLTNKRTLARQSYASYRNRNGLPQKLKNIKGAKSGGDKSGKKGK